MLRYLASALSIGLVALTLAACDKNPASPTPTPVLPGPTVAGPVPIDPADQPGGTAGTIENFSGDAGAFQFNLGSQVIRGDANTQIFDKNGPVGLRELGNNRQVTVSGWVRRDYLYAVKITIG